MPKLSVISHFYNHPRMVQDQIAYWESLPDAFLSQVEFVLIDDCSEQRPALAATRLDLRVFRVITDVPWNQSGARNLAAYVARGEWAMFADIDQKFDAAPLQQVIASLGQLDKQTMYHLQIKELVNILTKNRLLFAPSTFLVHLPTYRVRGMYDEDFAGHYGYEDLYAHQVWEHSGGKRVLLGDAIYFEDLGFGTTTLDRDNQRNDLLSRQKMATGVKNSPGILRFEWEQLALPAPAFPPAA
jgi:hypothetical protein